MAAQWSAIAAGRWEHPDAVAAREAEQARQRSLRGLTVAEWADAWIADLERTVAAGTLRKRRSNLRRHILPYLGNQELTALTPASLSQWWTDLDATPGARKNAYETLRALLNTAAADDRTLLIASPLRIKGAAREARVISKFLYTPT
ncbi:MAG: N-terminal phage integrase SAM-like domain-containing protein, partial [Pauljensenia sp.]